MIEAFLQDGRFPADMEGVQIEGGRTEEGSKMATYINTEVMPRSAVEFLGMFVPVLAAGLIGWIGVQLFDRWFGTKPWL